MPTVLSSSFPINVDTVGDDRRPSILAIHPLGTTLEFYDPLIEILSDRFFVVRFDLRGHGSSGGMGEPFSVSDLAGDAIKVLDALQIGRTHVLGASFGGFVAAAVAAEYAPRVDQLVLAGTSPELGGEEWWRRTMDEVSKGGMAAIVDHLDGIFFSEEWKLALPERREEARAMLLRTDPAAYIAGIHAMLDNDLASVAQLIRASTLLIAGENDPVFRHDPAEDLLALIPGSESVSVGGAKHRVLLEQPEVLAGLIVEFLTDGDAR